MCHILNISNSNWLHFWFIEGFQITPTDSTFWICSLFLLEVLFNMAVHSRYLSGPFSKRRSRSPFGRGCSTMGWKSEYGRLRSQVCMNPGCYLWYVYVYIYIIYIDVYYVLLWHLENFLVVVFVCGWSSPYGPVSLNLMNCADHGYSLWLKCGIWKGTQSYVQIDVLLRT